MASFEKKPNGKFLARVRRTGYPAQQMIHDTLREAKAWARAIEGQWDRGNRVDYGAARKTPLLTLMNAYGDSSLASKMAKQALPSITSDQICMIPLSDLTQADFDEYINRALDAGFKTNTVISHINIFHRAFVLAGQLGFSISHNPVSGVVRPKAPRGRDRRLTDKELKTLLSVCNQQTKSIVLLALATGMRQGEILGLEWRHVRPCQRTAYLPKTKNGEAREVPLSRAAISALRMMPKPRRGKVYPIGNNAFKMAFRRIVERANIHDFRFHDLRHEAISRLFERTGLRDIQIAQIVGHKTLAMTKRYTHLRAKDLAKLLD